MKTFAALMALLLQMTFAVRAQLATESDQERGWKVLEAAVKAAGGREKLAAVKDISYEFVTHVVSPQGEFDIPSKSWLILPNTIRQESTMPFGDMAMALDGESGWRKGPDGVRAITRPEVMRMEGDVERSGILFQPPRDKAGLKWATTETVGGRLCDVIEIKDVAGTPMRLAVDRATGDVLKRSYRAEGPDGKGAAVEEVLSDYRLIAGVRMPFHVRVTRNGQLARETITKGIRINTGLKAEQLMQRPS